MPEPDPIQEQLAAARRSQILDAATHVFSDKGYHQATIREVAQAAGIADGTIYNYFANKAAVQAAKEGKALPDGSVLFAEVYAAKLDADKKPVTGSDGLFVPDKLILYTAMARGAGWGKDFPEMLKKQSELSNAYFEKQTQRSQDLLRIAGEAQADVTQWIDQTSTDFTVRATKAAKAA